MKLNQILPAFWQPLLSAGVGELRVFENALDCNQCTASTFLKTDPDYHPARVKCCAFRPFIPNFRVREVMSQFPDAFTGAEILPLGLVAPASYQRASRLQPNKIEFICSFFSAQGQCGIWAGRPGPCATYFCRSRSGEAGRAFWLATEDLLVFLEQGLARLWMLEAGYEWREIEVAYSWLADDQAADLTREDQRRIWAHHVNEQSRFFERAERWFAKLDLNCLNRELGGEWRQMEERVIDAHRLTSWAPSSRGPV